MALTDRQKESILTNLRVKIRANCPMCGQTNWNLGQEIVGTMAASLDDAM